MAWTTEAPAKVNLDLRMRGLRADGYHLLDTVLQSIALADTLTLRPHPGTFALTCTAPGVPTDARNLAWKGAVAMADAVGLSLDGWSLHLDKHIPAEAGLGGGSADAAAAARLVAAAAGRVLDPSALAEVIRPLGADVAFFAWGGTVHGEGVGDQLTPLPDVAPAAVVLVRPSFGVSTADAYRWYDERVEAAAECSGGSANDLEGPVVARHPEIGRIVERLRGSGARLAAMSGSGSVCFGLFEPQSDLAHLAHGWPKGTRVWHTALIGRAAYAERTVCRQG